MSRRCYVVEKLLRSGRWVASWPYPHKDDADRDVKMRRRMWPKTKWRVVAYEPKEDGDG